MDRQIIHREHNNYLRCCMAGFRNEVIYANNVDFSGGSPVVGKVTTDGQLLIGATAAPNIRVATLTAGAGIGITNGAGSITITNTGSAFPWTTVAVNTSMAVENGYITNSAGQLEMLIPATAAVGDCVKIMGRGAGGFIVKQNANQTIHYGGVATTTGVGGSLASITQYDFIEIRCLITDTDWTVVAASANFTVV